MIKKKITLEEDYPQFKLLVETFEHEFNKYIGHVGIKNPWNSEDK